VGGRPDVMSALGRRILPTGCYRAVFTELS